MPITTVRMYGPGVKNAFDNNFDWADGTQTFKASLHTSTYTPNVDTDDFFNDATNELAAGSGYTAGGVAITGRASSVDAANDRVLLDCDDIVFPFTGAKTWRHMVLYRVRGGASTADELVGFMSWDSDQTQSASHTIQINAAGVFAATY